MAKGYDYVRILLPSVTKETNIAMKKYQVELTPSEREELHSLIRVGTAPAAAIAHARILLKADSSKGGPCWKDEQISDAFDVSVRTVTVCPRSTSLRL